MPLCPMLPTWAVGFPGAVGRLLPRGQLDARGDYPGGRGPGGHLGRRLRLAAKPTLLPGRLAVVFGHAGAGDRARAGGIASTGRPLHLSAADRAVLGPWSGPWRTWPPLSPAARRRDAETQRRGETETRRHGDAETRRRGETETKERGEQETPARGEKETPTRSAGAPRRHSTFSGAGGVGGVGRAAAQCRCGGGDPSPFSMAGAWKQTTYWKNSETLWVRDLMYPNLVGHYNLGLVLAAEHRHEEAIAQFELACRLSFRG